MPMTLRRRRRVPKARAIALMLRAVSAAVPMDSAPQQGLRESLRGVANYRLACSTGGREWSVDAYSEDFYVVTARGAAVPCRSLPGAVGHLRKMLGVR